jgi:hypothetical protein
MSQLLLQRVRPVCHSSIVSRLHSDFDDDTVNLQEVVSGQACPDYPSQLSVAVEVGCERG